MAELTSKGAELVLHVGSMAKLPGAKLGADPTAKLRAHPCAKLGTDSGAVLASGKRPVGHLGRDILGNIADDVDILAQAVTEMLNGLELLGGNAFILLQALELSSIVRL